MAVLCASLNEAFIHDAVILAAASCLAEALSWGSSSFLGLLLHACSPLAAEVPSRCLVLMFTLSRLHRCLQLKYVQAAAPTLSLTYAAMDMSDYAS